MILVYRRAHGRIAEFLVEVRRETVETWALRCPICFRWSRLRASVHGVEIHRDGSLSVRSSLICPDGACGWHVTIRHGFALDVNPPALEGAKQKAEIAAAKQGRRRRRSGAHSAPAARRRPTGCSAGARYQLRLL